MRRRKSEIIAILLAVLPAFVSLLGMGHLYAGRIRRGIIILIGGWALAGTGFLFIAAGGMAGMIYPPPGYPIPEESVYVLLFSTIGIALLLVGFALWVWQIIDARAVCQQYNKQINGLTPPSSQ